MKPWTPLRALAVSIRLLLGGLFLYAGTAKLLDLPALREAIIARENLMPLGRFIALEDFFWSVHHFALTSWDVSMMLAMFLPWIEIVAGLALILRRLATGALLIVTTLSGVFLAALASAWWRGLDLTCGCFGKEENATNYPKHLVLNGVMLAGCLLLAWLQYRPGKAASPTPVVPDARNT